MIERIRLADPRVFATLICGTLGICMLVWLVGAHKPWDVLTKDPELKKLTSIIRFYCWWAAAVNTLILAGLAASAWGWAGVRGHATAAAWIPKWNAGRWFGPLVGLAALAVLGQGAMRVGQSLWDDEDASVRTYIHGEWKESEGGEMTIDKREWKHAFFNNRRATNHQLQTIVSRVFHEAWLAVARPEGLGLSEPAIRLPVLLAAGFSVFTVAGLLARLGMARTPGNFQRVNSSRR
jgi:hypothetical protein